MKKKTKKFHIEVSPDVVDYLVKKGYGHYREDATFAVTTKGMRFIEDCFWDELFRALRRRK